MNTRSAFAATLELARIRGMDSCHDPVPDPWLSFTHLQAMERIMSLDVLMDPEKLNRWLGWAQCAVVYSGFAKSYEMAEINRRYTHKE